MFKFLRFYVMGKVLSGELSCPCDRSCCLPCEWEVVGAVGTSGDGDAVGNE